MIETHYVCEECKSNCVSITHIRPPTRRRFCEDCSHQRQLARQNARYQKSAKARIRDLVNAIHRNAYEKGFWEAEEKAPVDLMNALRSNKLMLAVSELGEAVEALRHNDIENHNEEIADTIIRLLDYCGFYGIDIQTEMLTKMAKNKQRPHKHGKEF